MNVGDKILKYRKLKGYSQEDIANSLNVSRQTVSKWETNQSTPELNKIVPLCELFGITADQLLSLDNETVINKEKVVENNETVSLNHTKKKFVIGLCISIFLYFVAVVQIILSDFLGIPSEVGVSIFLAIVAVATIIIIYINMIYKSKDKNEHEKNSSSVSSKVKSINDIMALFFLIIYLIFSFATGAWNVSWIIWVVYAFCTEIVKAVFELGGKDEK